MWKSNGVARITSVGVHRLPVDMSQLDMRGRKRTRFRGNFRPYHHRVIRGSPFRTATRRLPTLVTT